MEIVQGEIVDITEQGLVIKAPLPSIQRALLRQYKKVEVGLPDGRRISLDQRKKAYVLMKYISDFTGEDTESTKQLMKLMFLKDKITTLYKSVFSLSNCDVTTAKEFISFLIDFIIKHEIPIDEPLIKLCDDIERYVYTCLINKECAVCGKPAELHHIDAVGMGNNRNDISHIGKKVISLCRVHHSESHTLGQDSFLAKYHLVGVPLDKNIGKAYGMTAKQLREEAER